MLPFPPNAPHASCCVLSVHVWRFLVSVHTRADNVVTFELVLAPDGDCERGILVWRPNVDVLTTWGSVVPCACAGCGKCGLDRADLCQEVGRPAQEV